MWLAGFLAKITISAGGSDGQDTQPSGRLVVLVTGGTPRVAPWKRMITRNRVAAGCIEDLVESPLHPILNFF